MRPEALKYPYDMQQLCRLFADFLDGKTFHDYADIDDVRGTGGSISLTLDQTLNAASARNEPSVCSAHNIW